MKFVRTGQVNSTGRRPGDKPLSETKMVTHVKKNMERLAVAAS